MSLENNISSLSYTNKDFNSIYVELLEYAKELSYKWDPTASEESDPGVVLLKLAALIGDKNNYNIDKNVLELFPSSVTQLPAARQIFDQCGYTMRHYMSAKGTLSLTMKKHVSENDSDNVDYIYDVPMFTMFTDIDSQVVYTSTEKTTLSIDEQTSVEVIEGEVVQYTINNDPLITLLNLDNKNRLYFTDKNVAENGIFITNVGQNNYDAWKKVDNLDLEPYGEECYKFGLTLDGSACYIEFPKDADTLFKEGLNIHYVRSSGNSGNIAAKKIRKFYVDTKFTRRDAANISDAKEVSVTTDNVSIVNYLPIQNGADPESIDDAYLSYKRVKNTFDTIVSLSDYSDFMITSDENFASNGYVCDRTNDIQHVYKIATSTDLADITKTVVEKSTETITAGTTKTINGVTISNVPDNAPVRVEFDSMNPFDLCVYGLEYYSNPTTESSFKKSFKMIDSTRYEEYLNSEEIESLQHNFKDLECNRILMIKNKYPIIAHIIPRYKLELKERMEVLENVRKALYSALCSRRLTFGEEVSYNLIYDTVNNADERIKAASVEYPTYQTYAVFKEEYVTSSNYSDPKYRFKEIRVDSDVILESSELNNYTRKHLEQIGYIDSNVTEDQLLELANEVLTLNRVETVPDDPNKKIMLLCYIIMDQWNSFRAEIYAKNILSGVTPLYDRDTTFTYGVNQRNTTEIEVDKLTTKTEIHFNADASKSVFTTDPLRENESILLTSPNFVEENNFSSYVKIIYSFANCSSDTIASNAKYELRGTHNTNGDYIIFFWKSADSNDYYDYIKYDYSSDSRARVISPSFSMNTYQGGLDEWNIDEVFRNGIPVGRGTTNTLSGFTMRNGVTEEYLSVTEFVASLSATRIDKIQVLTGLQTIKTYKPAVTLINKQPDNSPKLGACEMYWFLNKADNGYYTLPLTSTNNTYTLASGEQFVYCNPERTSVTVLSEGTVIRVDSSLVQDTSMPWSVKALDWEDFVRNGIDYIEEWYKVDRVKSSEERKVEFIEMQRQIIGPENRLQLVKNTVHSYAIQGVNYDVNVEEDASVDLKKLIFLSIQVNQDDYDALYIADEKTVYLYQRDRKKESDADMIYNQKATLISDKSSTTPITIVVDVANIPANDNIEWLVAKIQSDVSELTGHLDPTNPEECLDNDPKKIVGYTISYINNEGSVTTIDSIDAKDFYWSAVSILNLNMSNEIPQVLRAGQSILNSDGTLIAEISQDSTKCVMSNRSITMFGGKDIDVRDVDDKPLKLLIFYDPYYANSGYKYTSDNFIVKETISTIPDSENRVIFSLLPGNYLMKLESEEPTVSVQEVVEEEDHISYLEGIKSVYKITVKDDTAVTMLLKADKDCDVTIYPLYKYTDETFQKIKDTEIESNVLSKLAELDKNNEFDYIRVFNSVIKNPLEPKSFHYPEHFYNKFTIDEWQEKDTKDYTDIVISSNIR